MSYPSLVRVRQQFDRPRVEDIPAAVTAELDRLNIRSRIRPGETVALTAGSRGIANIPEILRATAAYLNRLGAKPFLVPAMGSHGGATAEGQRKLIESYGITEEYVGVPIRSSMDVSPLRDTAEGYPVFLDRHAAGADHVAVVARVKPHTGFSGPIESGLLKMTMIGLGKHVGALAYHRLLLEEPYDRVVRSVSQVVREQGKVAFGLGVVENAYDETALIRAVAPDEFEAVEEDLLVRAKEWLARLPVDEADLLIVDEIGKDISGSGMDTNVVGRKRAFRPGTPGYTPPLGRQPVMRHIFVRGLSSKTHGNATGIGLADFTSTRLTREMNYRATVINCLTAGYPEGANLPVHFETDREVIDAALAIIGRRSPQEARVLHIRNTLMLEELEVSEPCLGPGIPAHVRVTGEARPFDFDDSGNLAPV